jgi:hypothetical protein
MLRDTDKFVCQWRTILWRLESEAVLMAFARWCAIQVVYLWDAPEIVLQYLRNGTATRAAAEAAAEAAAGDAARTAARDDAWAAARDDAWAAARDAANTQLENMILEAGTDTWIWELPEKAK